MKVLPCLQCLLPLFLFFYFWRAHDVWLGKLWRHFWANERKPTLLASSPEALAASRDMASSFSSNPLPFVFSQPSLYLTWQTEAQVSRSWEIYLCQKLKRNNCTNSKTEVGLFLFTALQTESWVQMPPNDHSTDEQGSWTPWVSGVGTGSTEDFNGPEDHGVLINWQTI